MSSQSNFAGLTSRRLDTTTLVEIAAYAYTSQMSMRIPEKRSVIIVS